MGTYASYNRDPEINFVRYIKVSTIYMYKGVSIKRGFTVYIIVIIILNPLFHSLMTTLILAIVCIRT